MSDYFPNTPLSRQVPARIDPQGAQALEMNKKNRSVLSYRPATEHQWYIPRPFEALPEHSRVLPLRIRNRFLGTDAGYDISTEPRKPMVTPQGELYQCFIRAVGLDHFSLTVTLLLLDVSNSVNHLVLAFCVLFRQNLRCETPAGQISSFFCREEL